MVEAGDMSADITSDSTSVRFLDQVLIRLKWTNGTSPVGDFFIDIAHYDDNSQTFDDWVPLTLASTPAASGASGFHQIHLGQVTFDAMRVRYVRTSGSGTLEVSIFAKDLGA